MTSRRFERESLSRKKSKSSDFVAKKFESRNCALRCLFMAYGHLWSLTTYAPRALSTASLLMRCAYRHLGNCSCVTLPSAIHGGRMTNMTLVPTSQ